MKLFLIRHGQTDWNIKEVFRGRIDIDLNENGKREGELLKEKFEGVIVDSIYSSPLSRAVQTAKFISETCNKEVIKDHDLIDMNFGEWEGKSIDEIRQYNEKLYQQWLNEPENAIIPQGETLIDVSKRVNNFIENELIKNGEKNIVVVTHRVIVKVMFLIILGLGNNNFWNVIISNSSLTIFNITDGKVRLELFNDICHLREHQSAMP